MTGRLMKLLEMSILTMHIIMAAWLTVNLKEVMTPGTVVFMSIHPTTTAASRFSYLNKD